MILRLLHVSPAGIVANKTTTVGLSPALHDYDAHYNKVKLCANFPPFKRIALCVHYTPNTEKKEDRATAAATFLFSYESLISRRLRFPTHIRLSVCLLTTFPVRNGRQSRKKEPFLHVRPGTAAINAAFTWDSATQSADLPLHVIKPPTNSK